MSKVLTKASNRQLLDRFLGKSDEIADFSAVTAPTMNEKCYAIIRNIPSLLRSKELRVYFSEFTENGKFACFHFRHRPELQATNSEGEEKKSSTCCCVVSFEKQATRAEFIKKYHGEHWTRPDGFPIPKRCFISAVKVVPDSEASSSDCLRMSDISGLVELRPPTLMPQGNVGTPSEYFLDQIKLCRLPASVITKLGIKTGRRQRKFGAVPFAYNAEDEEEDYEEEEEETEEPEDPTAKKSDTDPLLDPTDEWLAKNTAPDNGEGADDDKDECEEWERHEANYDDVTEQERTKPKKYEEEMEIVWEKGGPGLVWHMDKNYWDEREKGTDMDWKWADDWDVDYSVYYEGKSAGTLDGRHAVEMREDDLRWAGKLEDTVFRQKADGKKRKRRHSDTEAEDFSSEYGSKLMKKMGWKPGAGLGRAEQGRVEPVAVQLHEDANSGREKIGFGYRGEKMQRKGFEKKPVYHSIATKYDAETDNTRKESLRVDADEETSEILFRRGVDTKMKYRR